MNLITCDLQHDLDVTDHKGKAFKTSDNKSEVNEFIWSRVQCT